MCSLGAIHDLQPKKQRAYKGIVARPSNQHDDDDDDDSLLTLLAVKKKLNEQCNLQKY